MLLSYLYLGTNAATFTFHFESISFVLDERQLWVQLPKFLLLHHNDFLCQCKFIIMNFLVGLQQILIWKMDTFDGTLPQDKMWLEKTLLNNPGRPYDQSLHIGFLSAFRCDSCCQFPCTNQCVTCLIFKQNFS